MWQPMSLCKLGRGRVLGVVVVSAASLACGGFGELFGPGFDNAVACRQYVDTYNHLDCVPESRRLGDDVCPEWLDRSGCDLTEYYSCLTQSAVCRDGVPQVASRAECGDTACE